MTAGIEARGISVRVDGSTLVESVDLDLGAGEMAALVGPNGAGKTTLMRVLAGIRAPDGGSLRLLGRAMSSLSRRDIARQISWLPQEAAADIEIGVRDVVALGRHPHLPIFGAFGRSDLAAVDAALAALDLEALSDREIATLSGGERQRVFLARALAQEARFLLLDEPTSSLDIGHQLELMRLFASLHAGSRSLLVAMHDLTLVYEHFPRAILIDRGRIVADGPAREVLVSPAAESAFGVRIRAEGRSLRFAAE